MSNKHTIILLQYTRGYNTRTYLDFAGVNAAMDGVVKLFEHKLKEERPNSPEISYDMNDLNRFIDSLYDICALVMDPSSMQYVPKDKEWIKLKIFQHLRGQIHD